MSRDFELAVIGAGAVGLAVARDAADRIGGENVLLLERHRRVGQEISSRSSDVVHAGLYYEPGSLKARFCLEGAGRLLEFCRSEDIGCARLGKLVLAVDDTEISSIEALKRNGEACGARNLQIVDRKFIRGLSPLVDAVAALWSPNTAIFDSWEYMQRLKAGFLGDGGQLVFRAEVVDLDVDRGLVAVVRPGGEVEEIHVGVCVNSAGLSSDRIAEAAGLDTDGSGLRLRYCKGSYFSVRRGLFSAGARLIYPVPGHLSGGLGVHFTPDLAGGVRLGPDAQYVERTDPPDYRVDESRRDDFFESGRRLIPSLSRDDLEPDMAGIRPRLYGPGEQARDFEIVVQEGRQSSVVHLIGIESPGLTASLALARHVASLVAAMLT